MGVLPDENPIAFYLDEEKLQALPGETLLQAAQRQGRKIPHLCCKEGLSNEANCRACLIEIAGISKLVPACKYTPSENDRVVSQSGRAERVQQLVVELLATEAGGTEYPEFNELGLWRAALLPKGSRFRAEQGLAKDKSHPAIAFDPNACICCTRCLRACRELQSNDVIGLAWRGGHTRITFDSAAALGASSCVGCGACIQVCPTNALTAKREKPIESQDQETDSICPYCGVGCLLKYHVRDNEIISVSGRPGETNEERLCVKGRFGYDYLSHSQRLQRPLIRREGIGKKVAVDPDNPTQVFREASWDEALEKAAAGFVKIRQQHGGSALAGFGSAKGSNEEAYLFQKLVRTGFGTNNVDHCTRLCHASSVAALLEGIGSGSVSNPFNDVLNADVVILIGSNPEANHPVAASYMKKAAKAGSKLILLDPRRTPIARFAHRHLAFYPDTDVALLSGMLHEIVFGGFANDDFIRLRTSGFEEFKQNLVSFTPEKMAPICGVSVDIIKSTARIYAEADKSMIFWGMGVSQHVHGTDNARCLIALALVTGHIGRQGTGLHPLRGQNNVQGASDAGLIPIVYPDYQPVGNPQIREKFERLWQTKLSAEPGLTVVEIMDAVLDEQICGLYVMGENPAMSDPNLNQSRKALAHLDHLVVQDLYMTETAAYADVILPASGFAEKTGTFTNTDRRVQLGRQAVEPPAEIRQDLRIIQELAIAMGLDWSYREPRQVFDEMRSCMPSISGISWERLESEHSITYPCRVPGRESETVLFSERFPTKDGKARFIPVRLTTADELPDADYPFVFITGRILEHWHTGAMTRRSRVLDELEPEPLLAVHPDDCARLGLEAGDWVRLCSRRGTIKLRIREDFGLQPGQLFMPFCFAEAAANLLTNDALDPQGKIPEFKYCAARIELVEQPSH